jgi:hypothetical protein
VSNEQETLAGIGVIVVLMGLLALLLLRMARSREVDVEEDFWLAGPLDRVALGLPAALGQVPRLRVEVLDRTTFQLVRRVTPGWVYALFLVLGIFAAIAVALVKEDRRTPAVLVGTEHGPLLRVTGRLEKDQIPALRAALAPMTARA